MKLGHGLYRHMLTSENQAFARMAGAIRIRRLEEAGLPVMGPGFSVAGVAERTTGPSERGVAAAVGMEGPFDQRMPNGMAWNMMIDATAREGAPRPMPNHEQLKGRSAPRHAGVSCALGFMAADLRTSS